MLPNFLVAGVAKAGTTSLYYYLTQHPDIEIPRKETFYFAKEFYKNSPGDKLPFFRDRSRLIFTESEYRKFYSQCSKKATGEVSTCYAYFHETAVPLIKGTLGDVKIIFILRNPVERAFSAYMHFKRMNAEPLSFKDALDAEKSRMEKHWDFMWYYKDVGFYAKQLKAFKENFSDVKVFLSEDFNSNPQQVMKEVFHFIAVDERFVADTAFRYNESGRSTSPLLKKTFSNLFIKFALKKIISEKKKMDIKQKLKTKVEVSEISMDVDVRTELKNLYLQDMLELEKIIGMDLSRWK